MEIIGIIPARFNSKRFLGKLLYPINGKALLQHTYENALDCKILNKIYIATDNQKISNLADDLDAKYIMTSSSCINGTERIVEALINNTYLQKADIIVNIQGDHPNVSNETIEKIIQALIDDKEAVISTAVVPIEYEQALNENVVKCVFDNSYNAMYFSRHPIPYSKKKDAQHYYHIGIYAYRRDFLLKYKSLIDTKIYKTEDIEPLMVLENGFKIKVCVVNEIPLGVDVIEDVEKAEKIL